jgi:hypothetical protein
MDLIRAQTGNLLKQLAECYLKIEEKTEIRMVKLLERCLDMEHDFEHIDT